MKTVVKILLGVAIVFLAYICIMSIVTPIQFENIRAAREKEVVDRLIDIRKAEVEYKDQFNQYTDTMSILLDFVRNGKKKIVVKEGALTDAQLESGLTERQAVRIVAKGNMKEIKEKGLEGFRRDTVLVDVITELYGNKYTRENIDKMAIIPYSNNQQFILKVNNDYTNAIGIRIPLFEALAPYQTYLHDLDRQELINLIDKNRQMDKKTNSLSDDVVKNKMYGLKVGSIEEPNNNAGNWE